MKIVLLSDLLKLLILAHTLNVIFQCIHISLLCTRISWPTPNEE